MEDIGSFGPSVVIAVGLGEADVEELQDECTVRKFRLIVAARQADLPLSIQCDYAIVSALLPDGDGRRLASNFVRAGANVMIVDNAGRASVADAWSLGATQTSPGHRPADWLDELTGAEHVEAVSRAGRLMEAQHLADSLESAASFSGATGVPVAFVRIRPVGEVSSGLDGALDRLTSVVGMTTVFYDTPFGERLALVVNGDRRRLLRLLDDKQLSTDANITVVEITPKDDLFALLGLSRLSFRQQGDEDDRPKVLVALAPGRDKISETLRSALHRIDFSPLFWDASFRFEDTRSNPPAAVFIDCQLPDGGAPALLETALSQDPPVPVVGVADEETVGGLREILDAGASDFLVWPFSPGEAQASTARTVTIGSDILRQAADQRAAQSVASPDEQEDDVEVLIETELETPSQAMAESDETEAPLDHPESVTPIENSPAVEEETDVEPTEEPSDSVEAALAEVIGRRLAAGESITFDKVGVLSVRHETSRIIHDEKGRTIVEPPKRHLTFDPLEASESPSENP